jgi:integrase
METRGIAGRRFGLWTWIARRMRVGDSMATRNSLAILVRVMERAVRDGIIDRTRAGLQRQYRLAEDERDNPRTLALPDWASLVMLADAVVARSADRFAGWGDVVVFAACTAARIGEVSGAQARDINRASWTWTVRRQTTPAPGGLLDKGPRASAPELCR